MITADFVLSIKNIFGECLEISRLSVKYNEESNLIQVYWLDLIQANANDSRGVS